MHLTRALQLVVLVNVLSARVFAASKEKPPPPQPMTWSIPAAAAPGKTTRVTFHGAVSGQPLGLWTNFPAQATRAPDAGKEASFDLKIPGDVPVGIYAVRLATSAGLSNLQLFMIDNLPAIERAGKNTSPQSAQPISLPVAIDGACESLASDFYVFDIKAGGNLTFDLLAQRLGSRLDPMICITDESGREVAYCDDTPGLGSDCRFAHSFRPGRYRIEIRDADYQGGSEFRYRLRIGDFPAATVVFPIAGQRNREIAVEFGGLDSDYYKKIGVHLGDAPRQNIELKAKSSGAPAGFVSILTADRPDFVADAPNHSLQTAARVALPIAISGRFESAGQKNFYQFGAKKGDHLSIRAQTRSVNSPCDLYLQLFNPADTKIGESKAIAADEGTIDATIPSDGIYKISAEDLGRGAGPAYVYRLEITRPGPGFSLTAESDKLQAPAGSVAKLKIKCNRRDFDGLISLALTGDAAHFELKNQTIPKGKNETDLEIEFPAEGASDQPLNFTVIGTATIANRKETQTASTMAQLKALFPRLPYPPVELDGQIGLRIEPAK